MSQWISEWMGGKGDGWVEELMVANMGDGLVD